MPMVNCWDVWIADEDRIHWCFLRCRKVPRLDILVEAMGRVNFDVAIHDRKGITNKVELLTETDKKELKNWEVYSFPVDYDLQSQRNMRKVKNLMHLPTIVQHLS